MNHFTIAIDGPAGAGKSTIAKQIASKLDIIYIDTGAMYRTAGLYCSENKISLDQPRQVIDRLDAIDIFIKHIKGEQHVFLNGKDVNDLIRSNEAGIVASKVSSIKEVRSKMVKLQQNMAATVSVIMDGRDIGTHVLTDATLKIYLSASVEVRARRRYEEAVSKGESITLEAIKKDIIDRDYRDMNREVSPLRQAEDAILVDTSDMTIDEVVHHIIQLFGEVDGNYSS